MKRPSYRTLLLLTAGLLSCGPPLLDATYQGVPILSFEGQIYNYNVSVNPSKKGIRPGLFWSDGLNLHGEPKNLVKSGRLTEDNTIAVDIQFPSTFRVNVYKKPPEAWWVKGQRYALGFILLYQDSGKMGRYSAGISGSFVGQAFEKVVFYAAENLSADESPTRVAIDKGMYVIDYPIKCDRIPWEGKVHPVGCGGVPLGEPCGSHPDCGESGTCLTEHERSVPLAKGYCVLAHTQATDCFPANGVMLWGFDADDSYVFKACEKQSDCRVADGYGCRAGQQVCYPGFPITLDVDPGYVSIAPLCVEHVCSLCSDYVKGEAIIMSEKCHCVCGHGGQVDCPTPACDKEVEEHFDGIGDYCEAGHVPDD